MFSVSLWACTGPRHSDPLYKAPAFGKVKQQPKHTLANTPVPAQLSLLATSLERNVLLLLKRNELLALQDIGGYDVQKQEMKEAVELPLTHAGLYHQLGIDPPRGVLLYGPPGEPAELLMKMRVIHSDGSQLCSLGGGLLTQHQTYLLSECTISLCMIKGRGLNIYRDWHLLVARYSAISISDRALAKIEAPKFTSGPKK